MHGERSSVFDALRDARTVVTGGAGFVGSNIVRRLVALGADVVVLDDLFTGSLDNLERERSKITFVEGSVCDADLTRSVLDGARFVVHAAARNIIVSTKNPREDFEVNIGGTLNVLLVARELGLSRVVYTSTASVYGNPRYLPINEDDHTNTLSPYSVSKYAGENYCRAFYESYGVSTAVVRYSNVYGPFQRADNPYCGVIGKFFDAAMRDEPLQVHGDGEQTRDFTYVADVVDATLLAAVSPKAEGQTYNVATGNEVAINRLAREVIAVAGSRSELTHIDRRDIDNIRRRVLNIEKIRRELRWTPTVNIETGIRATYAWLRGDGE